MPDSRILAASLPVMNTVIRPSTYVLNTLPNRRCRSRMKLRIPAGLEKSEMKENVSPITGHPIVPGMSLISLEEPRDRSHRRPAHARATATSTGAPNTAIVASSS